MIIPILLNGAETDINATTPLSTVTALKNHLIRIFPPGSFINYTEWPTITQIPDSGFLSTSYAHHLEIFASFPPSAAISTTTTITTLPRNFDHLWTISSDMTTTNTTCENQNPKKIDEKTHTAPITPLLTIRPYGIPLIRVWTPAEEPSSSMATVMTALDHNAVKIPLRSSSMLGRDLVSKIAASMGLNTEAISVMEVESGRRLCPQTTLQDQGILPSAKLHVLYSKSGNENGGESNAAAVNVQVRIFHQRHLLPLSLTPKTTIAQLKQAIQEAKGVPPDQQAIWMANETFKLHDTVTLREYGITNATNSPQTTVLLDCLLKYNEKTIANYFATNSWSHFRPCLPPQDLENIPNAFKHLKVVFPPLGNASSPPISIELPVGYRETMKRAKMRLAQRIAPLP